MRDEGARCKKVQGRRLMHFGGKSGGKESGWDVPVDQERKEQDSVCEPQSTACEDTLAEAEQGRQGRKKL